MTGQAAGVGRAAAKLSKIFDWYTRCEHSGSISVESEVGKGSTFTVRRPA